jgi:hypothetical protein
VAVLDCIIVLLTGAVLPDLLSLPWLVAWNLNELTLGTIHAILTLTLDAVLTQLLTDIAHALVVE